MTAFCAGAFRRDKCHARSRDGRGDKCARRRRGDEGTVSARRGARVSRRASSRVRVVRVRDRDSGETRRARSRRSRRAPSVPDSAKSPSREPRRRRIFSRCASSGRAWEAVSWDIPGCRRGRNRPGTWSPPCRDRGRCPAGRRRCPRPCPSSGTSGPSRRCPCRAGRGWRRAGGARRGRPHRPETKERGIRRKRVSAERALIERDARVARARRRDAAPVSSHRGSFSRVSVQSRVRRDRVRAPTRARDRPRRVPWQRARRWCSW